MSRIFDKTETTRFRWFLNIFLALLIFFTAELGRLLGFQGEPFAISVVWPAAGFSLAALLVFGYKVWPSIVVGNFCYNFLHLYSGELSLMIPLLASLAITIGALLEALVAAFVMMRFSTPFYFSTVRDIFIFLIPAAGLGTAIAATTHAAIFSYYTGVLGNAIIELWITFWTSDLLGVYIFTPLLVVWLITKPMVEIRQHRKEAFFMLASFVIIGYLSFAINPLLILSFIPLNMWITYRFRMHWATLAIFFIFLVTIVPTFFGIGSFITDLSFFMAFLEVIVIISLLFAALVNEREAVVHLLKSQNVDLKQAVEWFIGENPGMSSRMSFKEQLVSLGRLAPNIAQSPSAPLKMIGRYAESCLESVHKLQNMVNRKKGTLDPEFFKTCENAFHSMEKSLDAIVTYDAKADAIIKIIHDKNIDHKHVHQMNTQELTAFSNREGQTAAINLNELLNICLIQAIEEETQNQLEFTFTLTKKFDPLIKKTISSPEDLALIFINFFSNALHSMRQKKDLRRATYVPELDIRTINKKEYIEIIIRDNGLGITDELAKKLFQPIGGAKEGKSEKVTNVGLSLAQDIIVSTYHGTIRVESIEGEYFQLILTFPK